MRLSKVINRVVGIALVLWIAGTVLIGSLGVNSMNSVLASPALSMGDQVRTTANLNVREGPGLSYSVITAEPVGSTGVVVCSTPQSADNYTWWVIKYADGTRGWSAENYLEKIGSISVTTNLLMPYIHQCYDTRDDFNGLWACGATSAVMVVAYYGKVDSWPYTCSYPYSHVSNYGNYVSQQYTSYTGEVFGDAADEETNDASGNPAKGAYGYIHYSDGNAKLGRMVSYFKKHGLDSEEKYAPSEPEVKAQLDAGYPVPASTKLTAAGHWIVIKGYTNSGYYVVNDPNGCKPYKGDTVWGLDFNYCGEDVLYTWDEMKINEKWIAIVQPSSDATPPTVDAFSVNPSSITLGNTFTISYTVSDTGGSGLSWIELWRKYETGDWEQIDSDTLSGVGNGPYSSYFYDTPSTVGTYWYGIHVGDNAGNWDTEDAPIDVEVIEPNNPPNMPSSPSPSNHATSVSISANLSWSGGDPDYGDTVTYDVYFGTSSIPPLVSNDQLGTTYDPSTLNYSTSYYWKIIASDSYGASTEGPIWDFTTESAPNAPPEVTNVTAYQGSPIVNITYDVSDTEQFTVSISFEYWDGGSWQPCITTTGEGTQTTGTSKSGTWEAKTDFDGHYLTDCKIRVTADDGQVENNIGSAESSVFTLDTKDPTSYGCNIPTNEATGVSINPDLTCLIASDDSPPISYYFQLAENDTFSLGLQESGWQTSTTWVPSTLDYSTQYFWRVKSKDSYGNETDYSSTFHFTTEAASNNPPNPPTSPLCEGATNPTDVTDPTPEFSWTFSDPDGGDTQGAYQILVASTLGNLTADNGDMWDSGKVSTSDSESSYFGTALAEGQTYYWKVKTWDTNEAEGPYCGGQQFTTGIFPTEVWVDDDYCDGCANDGHTWGYDAFATIKDGFNVLASGTVNVAAGTYYEFFSLGDGVEVLGAGADVTTIFGSVVVSGGVGPTTVLDGFTITNGGGGPCGGGMHISESSPTVTNCIFSGSSAEYGGGMYNSHSSPTVINCVFSGNSAYYGGGGMRNENHSSPTVTNCTFFGNSAQWGGGMDNLYYSSPTVTNCIFWNNGEEIYNDGTSAPVVTYCDVEGGYSGTGNIDADPMFVNPVADDYHLLISSPCIDVGNNSAPSLPSTDFDGDPRIVDGDGDTIAVVDMGADEYSPILGLLRVETSPPVPTTIFVDGIPRNDWSLDWVKMPPGEYMLSFSDVTGYATPTEVEINYYPGGGPEFHSLSEPIEILPDTVTEVIVEFTQLGNLWVETSPAVQTTISLNGSPANGWGFWVDLLPGDYNISVTGVTAFSTPVEVEVTYPGELPVIQDINDPIAVVAGGTTHAVLHFAQLGNLWVETSPPLPATIFLDGNPMNDWSFWVSLEPGEYWVSFEDMDGYLTPPPTLITVIAGATTHVIGDYDNGIVIINP